jgi:hypothetical protein
MLVLKNEKQIELNPTFTQLLADFRRTHVSRFPVEVVVRHDDFISFVDSRFPVAYEETANVNKILGSVYMSDDKLVVESRLVKNDKYNMHNSDYHTRKTQDLRKVLKYMKEYIKPYTAHEIANRTLSVAEQHFADHKDRVVWKARDYRLHDMDAIYAELIHMKAVGYEPKTEALRKIMSEGFEHIEHSMRIKDTEFPRVHVYIAPDETVNVAVLSPKSGLEVGVTSYESLAVAPTFIQQHVGMLKIMEDRSHVPDIGYKASATEFWIEGFSQ